MTARTPGPHECPKHEPGTYACYSKHLCPCPECLAVTRRYHKRARSRLASGKPARVDAAPLKRHAERMLATGMGRAELARLADVEPITLTRLLRGDLRTMRRDRAARLAAVRPVPVTRQHLGAVPVSSITRRIDALALRGWSAAEVARRAGSTPGHLGDIRGQKYATAATRAAVAAVYDDLWNLDPPPTCHTARTIAMAQRRGAVPALAWDDGAGDHGIDNPAATPHPWTAGPTKRQGPPVVFEVDDLAFMAECGDSLEAATARLGVTASAIQYRLTRAGRPDILARLYANRERRVA